jgi:hypothetical protein
MQIWIGQRVVLRIQAYTKWNIARQRLAASRRSYTTTSQHSSDAAISWAVQFLPNTHLQLLYT